eukprot:10070004-Lingulodinium_polyedra.AAC.1
MPLPAARNMALGEATAQNQTAQNAKHARPRDLEELGLGPQHQHLCNLPIGLGHRARARRGPIDDRLAR